MLDGGWWFEVKDDEDEDKTIQMSCSSLIG